MRKEKHYQVNTVLVILLMLGNSLLAAQTAEDALASQSKWKIELTPYFWIADLDGDATLRGRTGPVEADFSDIIDHLDFALMGRVEAWKGKWGLTFDGLYMDLGADFSTPRGLVSTDMDFKMQMYDFGMGYRLMEKPVGKNKDQMLSFDLLGGGRYIRFDGEIDIKTNGPLATIVTGRKFSRAKDWVEPFIGGRLKWSLNDKLAAAVRADWGGFGIGEGSDLTWNLLAGIDYKFSKRMSLKAGYRIFDIDFSNGSGSKKFGLDAQFRGPIFGLTILL